MTALSADRKTQWKDNAIGDAPVLAEAKIYLGAMVCIDAAGYAIAGANAAGNIFAGIAEEHKDATGLSNGDIRVQFRRRGVFKPVGAGLAQSDVGSVAYLSDDQTITTTPTNVRVGIIVDLDSATEPWVAIDASIAQLDLPVDTFIIPFFHKGTVGATPIILMEDCELPRAFNISAAYAKCQTAPGGAYVCTVTLTDGTGSAAVTITGAATKGEDETLDVDIPADTDFDVTIVDDDAAAATEDVQGYFVCSWT